MGVPAPGIFLSADPDPGFIECSSEFGPAYEKPCFLFEKGNKKIKNYFVLSVSIHATFLAIKQAFSVFSELKEFVNTHQNVFLILKF
jgi:hypothetical protein